MVTIGMLLMMLSAVYLIGMWRRWSFVQSRLFRWLIVLGGPLVFISLEAGWWLAEVGRQPWILRNIMRTSEGATTSGQVPTMLVLFALLYLVLGIGSVVVLRRMFIHNPVEQEIIDRQQEKGGDIR